MWVDLQDFSSPLEPGGGTDQGTGPPQGSKTSQLYLQSLISRQPEEERRVKINPIGCEKDVNSSEEKGILDGRHLGIPTDLHDRPLCLLASLDHPRPPAKNDLHLQLQTQGPPRILPFGSLTHPLLLSLSVPAPSAAPGLRRL